MTERWGNSALVYEEFAPGVYACRITNCQTGDTVTFPVKKVVACVGHDEITATVLKCAVSTNVVTITCTNNDEVNLIAVCIK